MKQEFKQVKPAANLDSAENQANHAKFKAKADEQQAKDAAAVKLFNPTALLARSSQIHELQDPTLGTVKFGELTLADSDLTAQCKSKSDKTAMAIYIALKKAYPDMPNYTPETIGDFFKQFPIVEGTALLNLLLGTPDFLPNDSPSGSEPTATPKK